MALVRCFVGKRVVALLQGKLHERKKTQSAEAKKIAKDEGSGEAKGKCQEG